MSPVRASIKSAGGFCCRRGCLGVGSSFAFRFSFRLLPSFLVSSSAFFFFFLYIFDLLFSSCPIELCVIFSHFLFYFVQGLLFSFDHFCVMLHECGCKVE